MLSYKRHRKPKASHWKYTSSLENSVGRLDDYFGTKKATEWYFWSCWHLQIKRDSLCGRGNCSPAWRWTAFRLLTLFKWYASEFHFTLAVCRIWTWCTVVREYCAALDTSRQRQAVLDTFGHESHLKSVKRWWI